MESYISPYSSDKDLLCSIYDELMIANLISVLHSPYISSNLLNEEKLRILNAIKTHAVATSTLVADYHKQRTRN